MTCATLVDSRGRACPLPIIDLARAMADTPLGGAVRLLADDPAAGNDVAAWCRMRSQELTEQVDEGDHQAFLVTRRR